MISKWLPPVDQKITDRWNQRANNQLSLDQRKNMLFMQDDGSFLSSLLFWICPMQWYVPRIFLKKHILSWQQSYQWLCYLKQKFGQVYHCLCKMHLKWVSFKAMYRYVEMLILNRLIDYICFYIYLDVKDTCILLWFLFIFEVHVQLWIFRELKKCSVWLFSKQNVFWSSPCYLIYI